MGYGGDGGRHGEYLLRVELAVARRRKEVLVGC